MLTKLELETSAKSMSHFMWQWRLRNLGRIDLSDFEAKCFKPASLIFVPASYHRLHKVKLSSELIVPI